MSEKTLLFPMTKAIVPYYDFRKRITNPYMLTQLQLIAEERGLSISEVCWKFITESVLSEKKLRERKSRDMEEIKSYKHD